MEYSSKIINAFQDECTDLLISLDENILQLEKEQDNPELINELFRTVHSLKSETALMGFNNFGLLAHKYEDLLQQVRDGKLTIESGFFDLSLKISDKFKEMMDRIVNAGNDSIDVTKIFQLLGDFFKETETVRKKSAPVREISLTEQEIKKFEAAGFKNIFYITIKLFDNVALKYARAYMIYNDVSSAGKVVMANVDFKSGAENDNQFANFSIIVLTNKTEKDIYNIMDCSEVEKISIKKIAALGRKPELTVKAKESVAVKSIRINVEKIEDLMNSVGELILNYNRVEKFYDAVNNKQFVFDKNDKSLFFDIVFQFKRIIDIIQDNAVKFRMIPIKSLFDKFPRLIRTISNELNKEVNLSISGEDTEIDRNVIELIRKPLTHIIRNAIDHGLERREERIKKGKSGKGTIKISAYQSGNNIIVEIADDGRGIDIEKIKRTVEKKSLVSKAKLKKLTPSQLLSFIFLPGFSTSSSITELSGRGVGMDVVKTNINKIRGKVFIKTKKDKGSSFMISIPLTVSIIKALIVRTGNIYFALPLYSIRETLRIFEKDIEIVDKYEVVRFRKELLSILRIKEIFNLSDMDIKEDEEIEIFMKARKKREKRLFIVVVSYGHSNIGLVVDQLVTEQEIVIKPLSQFIKKTEGITGVTVLGDGNVAYILDPVKLINYYLSQISEQGVKLA